MSYLLQLKCTDEWEYLPALHSLGALAADGLETVLAILSFADSSGEGILVKKIADFLINANQSVQLAAAGALR